MNSKTYHYAVPQKINDGWEPAHLKDVNIDSVLITDLFDQVIKKKYKNIHSVLILRNRKLVVEEYFDGLGADSIKHSYKRDTMHYQASVTKTVNSILVGIAIDLRLIRSVDEKISTFFPEYVDIFADSTKAKIRLRDCLSMTAGLNWDEWQYTYTNSLNDHIKMNNSNDPIRYILERQIVEPPGTKFVYNSGLSIILGQIIYKVSGLKADAFAERYLFAPLGISNYSWWKYPNGTVQTGGGLSLQPRAMAKIGYLFLEEGRWQGKQIVSEAWVKESTKKQAPSRTYWFERWPFKWGYSFFHKAPLIHFDYGYQWWLRSFRARDRYVTTYSAEGRGGQFIFIVPEIQLVAVFTGWNDNRSWDVPFQMLQKYILTAVN